MQVLHPSDTPCVSLSRVHTQLRIVRDPSAVRVPALTCTLTGADPNHLDEGRAALHVAARRAQSAVIGELVRAGADPNLVQEDTLYTPLHAATLRGHCDAIAELVRWGADLNRGDYKCAADTPPL